MIQSFINSMRDAVLCIDGKRRILEFNKAAEQMFGYKREAVLLSALEVVVAPSHLANLYKEAMEHYLLTGESALLTQRFESEALRSNGHTFPVDISIARNPDVGSDAFTVFIRDISERKEIETRMMSHMAALERMNQELKQFVYVASHDLQEPLRMITSFSQLLSRRYSGKMGPEADEFIGYMVEGSKRMQALILSLVNYSRAGRVDIPLVSTPSGDAVKEAISNLKTLLEETGAEVTFEGLPSIYSDSVQLTQLFQNLIGNAVKFCDGHHPKISITAERKSDGWNFSVKDNGIGMEPDDMKRIFTIFARLHERSKYAGTGIGLAICKKIVERHGGKIWVESVLGEGSVFHFSIPDGTRQTDVCS